MQANFQSTEVSWNSQFGINIFGLEEKVHDYEFRIDSSFFSHFENIDISKGLLNCKATLNKTSSFIRVTLWIQGSVELTCDRSLDLFDFPMDIKGNITYKFGDEEKEIDDEVLQIPRSKQQINLAHPIYELIVTAIPMKKLHPRYSDEPEENGSGLYYTTEKTTGIKQEEKNNSDPVDPRWEKLKQLKKKSN